MTEFFCFLCNKTHNQIFSFMRHLKTWKKNSQTVISGYLLSGSADDKISRGHGGRHFITTLSMIMMSSYRVVLFVWRKKEGKSVKWLIKISSTKNFVKEFFWLDLWLLSMSVRAFWVIWRVWVAFIQRKWRSKRLGEQDKWWLFKNECLIIWHVDKILGVLIVLTLKIVLRF